MTIASVAAFVDALRQHQVLEPSQLGAVASPAFARFAGPKQLANELLQRGWLTAYQINQLFRGRGQELMVGPYLLLERLGEGKTGIIFKARHRKQGHLAALKLIRKELLVRPEVVREFQHDIRAAAQLSHPHIIHLLSAGQAAGTYYLALEYVAGGRDLERVVKRSGPLAIAQACACVRQVASALQEVHQRGLVHGDLKPSNLVLADPGRAKILDLGLGCLKEMVAPGDGTFPTRREESAGDPNYCAPEATLPSGRFDSRADLYSLGCIFYFLLTGQAPFGGEAGAHELSESSRPEPRPVEQLRPHVPPAIAAVVRKLMAPRPEDRYQTPAEVLAALAPGGQLAAVAEPVRPEGPSPTERPPPVSLPAPAAAEQPQAVEPEPEHECIEIAATGSPSDADDEWMRTAETVTIKSAANAPLAPAIGEAPRPALEPAAELVAAPASESPAGDEAGWVMPVDTATAQTWSDVALPPPAEEVPPPAPAPHGIPAVGHANGDGSSLAMSVPTVTVAADSLAPRQWAAQTQRWRSWVNTTGFVLLAGLVLGGAVFFLRGDTDTPTEEPVPATDPVEVSLDCGDPEVQVILKREGQQMATLGRGGEGTSRLRAGQYQLEFDPHGPAGLRLDQGEVTLRPGKPGRVRVLALPLSPSALVSRPAPLPGVRTWTLMLRDDQAVGTAKLAAPAPRPQDAALCLAWTNDSLALAVGGPDGLVTAWSLESDSPLRQLKHDAPVTALAWSPDGSVLAAACDDQPLWLWRLETGSPVRTAGGQHGVRALAWSPDGKGLAAGGRDKAIQLWDTSSGKLLLHLTGHTETVEALAWSSDGKTLASACADHSVRLWEAATGKPLHTLSHDGAVAVLAWSRDDKTLATGGADGTVRLWVSATGRALRTLPGQQGAIHSLAWLADGQALACQGADGLVRLWDANSGQLIGYSRGVDKGFLSPNGRLLVSTGGTYTARFWDSLTGRPHGTIVWLPKGALVLGADGHYRGPDGIEDDLVYVVESDEGRKVLRPGEFALKYRKNDPRQVRFTSN
jgi:serine/threonine-protein kinase